MKQQTKKVIAREALIILTVAMLLIASFVLGFLQTTQEVGLKAPFDMVPIFIGNSTVVLFPKGTEKSLMEATIKRDFILLNSIMESRNPLTRKYAIIYDSNGIPLNNTFFYKINFSNIHLFVVFVYLVYLLLRFVSWAVRTLRKKEATA